MATSYSDSLGLRYRAKKNWPVTLLVGTIALFLGAAVFSLAIGFPSIAGILAAYMIIMLLIVVGFVILPVYALGLLD